MIQLNQRFIITENCNASCPHCFNANVRGGGEIDADIFIEYLRKNSDYIRNHYLRLMGGEPTVHPRFADIVEEAAKHVRIVELYTNGLKLKEIVKLHPVMLAHFEDKLRYCINGYTCNFDKIIESQQYIKAVAVHFVVTLDGTYKMLKKFDECLKLFPLTWPVISADSQVNIFDEDVLNRYRKVWMEAVKYLVPKMRDGKVDHSFPMCFYTQDMIDELAAHGMEGFHMIRQNCCAEVAMGLIDWNWDLYYCNQTRIKIGSILNDEGKPKLMPEILEMINKKGTNIKTEKIIELSDMCRNCLALPACKLGCFYNTLERECKTC